MKKLRKVVIPIAGLGTRMLPATKAIPKEMLPVVDKPIIQYIVEEAEFAGFKEIIFVTHSSKYSVENHFDTSFELEATLEKRVKRSLLKSIKSISNLKVTIHSVRQGEAKGLGHAIHCAKSIIGDEPFGIMLPDISEKIEIGKGRIIQEGKKIALINFGARLNECKIAAQNLEKRGLSISIVDARFCKPLDENLMWQVARNHEILISIEEGSIGGFGSHLSKFLSDKSLLEKIKFRSMILPDRFIEHNDPKKMYAEAGLDSQAIQNKIYEIIDSKILAQKQN